MRRLRRYGPVGMVFNIFSLFRSKPGWIGATRELKRNLMPHLEVIRKIIRDWQWKHRALGAQDTASTEAILRYLYNEIWLRRK